MHPRTLPDPASMAAHPLPNRRLPSLGSSSETLSTMQRRVVVAAIVGLHVVAVWALLQVQAVRDAAVRAAPILVSLLATPVPPAPPPPTPVPVPVQKPQPRAKVQPAPPPQLLATTATPMPESITVPPPQEVPAPVAAPAPSSVVSAEPAVAAAPAPPPAPKLLPDNAVQYLQSPQVVYPPLSLRRAETGLVIVRAYVGTDGGAPRKVQVERSSGHARLDQAALVAVQAARFRPYAEKGQSVEGWALIPIRFQLEK
jgi:periplasmic protein TonB